MSRSSGEPVRPSLFAGEGATQRLSLRPSAAPASAALQSKRLSYRAAHRWEHGAGDTRPLVEARMPVAAASGTSSRRSAGCDVRVDCSTQPTKGRREREWTQKLASPRNPPGMQNSYDRIVDSLARDDGRPKQSSSLSPVDSRMAVIVPMRAADLPKPVGADEGVARSSSVGDLALSLLRGTPVPTVILDASQRIQLVSDSYLLVSGATNALGRHADDVFSQTAAFPAHATACELLRAAQDSYCIHEAKLLTESGSAWRIRAVPVVQYGRIHCIHMEFRDVTEEHKLLVEMEERNYANETYRILVETVKDYAIFMLDPNGYVATWNAGARNFKGYSRDEIVGKHFSNFYGQEDRDADKPGRELRDALRDGRCEDEGWRIRSDGSRFWANVVITPVYKDGNLLGFSKVTRDLTERRKAEQKLIAAYEEAAELKSLFLANMSHEIRTPMHGMLSALTLLLDTKLDDNQLDLAHVIQESGDVLLQVINDILDYSKLASGSFTISHDIINVADIVQSVIRAQTKLQKSEVELQMILDHRLPKAAEGDSLRYRQILQNLLSNATKFTEEGYVHVTAKLEDEDTDSVTVLTEVIDTGIGIPSVNSNALFTPFTQFDNSATKRYKGTGLGLSICKSLAELMGGKIGYHANPEGHGSVFWFTSVHKKCRQLKVLELEGSKPSSLTSVESMTEIRRAATGKRILIAEDNHINRKVMLRMLSAMGFTLVDVALDGREAVSKITSSTVPFDLVLMDVNMPVQDGLSATREVREHGYKTPIIAMTANALKGQAESYIAKGMTGYIAKPVDRALLIKILLKHLQNQPAD